MKKVGGLFGVRRGEKDARLSALMDAWCLSLVPGVLLGGMVACGVALISGCGGSAPLSTTSQQPVALQPGPSQCTSNETVPAPGTDTWITGFQQSGQSLDLQVAQGYSSCGNWNYFFNTNILYLSSSYDQMQVLKQNNDVLVPGANHMGDGDVYNGNVYTVIENWAGCTAPPSVAAIRVFDAGSLQSVQVQDITADQHEVSGIAVIPGTGTAVVSSYCDGSKLFVYSLASLTLQGTIPLPTNVSYIQGVAYHNGFLYLANTDGKLYGLRLSDGTMRLLMQGSATGEYEGLDFHSGELRWLVNEPNNIHILYQYQALNQ